MIKNKSREDNKIKKLKRQRLKKECRHKKINLGPLYRTLKKVI